MIYVLKLAQGKYYVGYTNDFSRRIGDHYNKTASWWTAHYPVEKVLLVRDGDKQLETTITRLCREHWGKENVRGGPWVYDTPSHCHESELYHRFKLRSLVCDGVPTEGDYLSK